MIPRKLKYFNLFVDGRGYAGKIQEAELPKLAIKDEEFRAGGMDAPLMIDLGMEKLECKFTLGEYNEDTIRLFGLQDSAAVSLRLKGSIESDDLNGFKTPVEVVIQGRWKEMEWDKWKAGDDSTKKVAVAVSYYRYISNGETLVEIDVPNMIRIINGVDYLAVSRANIGL